ncbi:G-protein-signaling modulator 1 isoform X3 [Xenopus laevis]|uniref:G-protein-signaling modulator 1 isoform X3 n=1 Tax=Xenopus laevis TaxID=8355 RepID=A0A8J0THL0_XENLA|nr:G-protein-signaling modulator 1 isoform X3 [Xenopus laevis]
MGCSSKSSCPFPAYETVPCLFKRSLCTSSSVSAPLSLLLHPGALRDFFLYPVGKINRAPSDEECFFDLLSKFQSSRMDEQRCTLDETETGISETSTSPVPVLEDPISSPSLMASPQTEELFDLIATCQSRRLDEQRASVGKLPGLRLTHNNVGHLRVEGEEPGDDFFNMLMKCQSSRIDEQRCAPPDAIPRGPTVPDDDFFSLIQRVQAKRIDEQRVDLSSNQQEEARPDPLTMNNS